MCLSSKQKFPWYFVEDKVRKGILYLPRFSKTSPINIKVNLYLEIFVNFFSRGNNWSHVRGLWGPLKIKLQPFKIQTIKSMRQLSVLFLPLQRSLSLSLSHPHSNKKNKKPSQISVCQTIITTKPLPSIIPNNSGRYCKLRLCSS